VIKRGKQLLKTTPIYRLFKLLNGRINFRRAAIQIGQWTSEDQAMLEFYKALIRPGDLCFDVGANVGNRTKIFLKLGAKVIAFEPQPECQRVLSSHFGANPRFTLLPVALGAADGQLTFYRGDANTISTLAEDWIAAVKRSGRFSGAEWRKGSIVEVKRLDGVAATYGNPRFIKIDVEGFELEVLMGCSAKIPALSLEVTVERLSKTLECIERVESLGAMQYNLSQDSRSFVFREWKTPSEISSALVDIARSTPLWSGDLYARSTAT
jgi:FkbM family methyltransferase